MRRKREAGKHSRGAQFVREKALASPFGGLKYVTDLLNNPPDADEQRDRYVAFVIVSSIVSADSLEHARNIFNRHAKDHPVSLHVGPSDKETQRTFNREMGKDPEEGLTRLGDRLHVTFDSLGEVSGALQNLWFYYFQDHGWQRLKRCPVCQQWFVDVSKNKSTARCSSACTWKFWNRAERRKAGHTQLQPTKGGRHGKK